MGGIPGVIGEEVSGEDATPGEGVEGGLGDGGEADGENQVRGVVVASGEEFPIETVETWRAVTEEAPAEGAEETRSVEGPVDVEQRSLNAARGGGVDEVPADMGGIGIGDEEDTHDVGGRAESGSGAKAHAMLTQRS
jgi:hypothetical protein